MYIFINYLFIIYFFFIINLYSLLYIFIYLYGICYFYFSILQFLYDFISNHIKWFATGLGDITPKI